LIRVAAWRSAVASRSVWLLPVALIGLIYFSPKHVVSASTALTGLVAFCILLVAARWPHRSLIALIVLLPFQGFILAKLSGWGVPSSIVRHLGAWKETLALGVVLAGARNFIASGRRADALDRLGLGFVAIALVYLAVQHTILPSAPSSSSTRLLGFRQDAGFVLLLLGARHAPLPPGFLRRAGTAAFVVAAIVACIAIFSELDSSGWNHFVVRTVQYTRYEQAVLHTKPVNFYDIRTYGSVGGIRILRAGSVFLNPLTLGFYLVLGFALGLERIARGQSRFLGLASLLAITAGILLTQTRSAIVGALVVALVALQPSSGRSRHWRVQLGLILAAIAIMAVPTALATGLSQRVTTTTGYSDNAGHVTSFGKGVETVAQNPLGLGLGTSAGVGQRSASQVSNVVVPEDTYLQMGVELGIVGMLLFIALTVALVAKLRAVARRHPHYVVAAMAAAAAGISVGAFVLQPWTDFSVAWTVWGLAGVALGAGRIRVRRPVPEPSAAQFGSVSKPAHTAAA
jgi:hypothetical protein